MIHGKCYQPECEFRFDDADYMDDVHAKLRSHFRDEHPTKHYYEHRSAETQEVLNYTCDELIGMYLGRHWRADLEGGRIAANQVATACGQACRNPGQYREEVIREVMAVSEAHGRVIPDPFEAAALRGAQGYFNGMDAIMPEFFEDEIR